MSTIDWLVVASAVALSSVVLWYFFASSPKAAKANSAGTGPQEILIEVRGGYSPRNVQAQSGRPLALIFDRQDKSSCSEEIVIADFGIRRFLPALEKTRVEIPAPKPGRYEFTCGMGMLHGTLEVV